MTYNTSKNDARCNNDVDTDINDFFTMALVHVTK